MHSLTDLFSSYAGISFLLVIGSTWWSLCFFWNTSFNFRILLFFQVPISGVLFLTYLIFGYSRNDIIGAVVFVYPPRFCSSHRKTSPCLWSSVKFSISCGWNHRGEVTYFQSTSIINHSFYCLTKIWYNVLLFHFIDAEFFSLLIILLPRFFEGVSRGDRVTHPYLIARSGTQATELLLKKYI